MTLSSLIERLEKAEGPDRELDADIAAAVLGGEIQWWQTAMTGDAFPVRKYPSKDHIRGFGREPVQRYTSSIDAALTLVLDTYEWEIGGGNPNFDNPAWCDICPREQPYLAELEFFAEGVNSAIAICIAALKAYESLRARSAMTEERSNG